MSKLIDKIKGLRLTFKIFPIVILLSIILFVVGIVISNIAVILIPIALIFVSFVIMGADYLLHGNTFMKKGSPVIDKILQAINGKDSVTIQTLTMQLSQSESQIRSLIYDGIRDGSLKGYTLKGDALVDLNFVQQQANEGAQSAIVIECAGCGATYQVEDGNLQCPFCGRINNAN